MNVQITEKDLDIFVYMSRLRFLTAAQTASLFYADFESNTFDLKHSKHNAVMRLNKLIHAGYLKSALSSDHRGRSVKVYFLDKAGANIIRDLREMESTRTPDMLHRKSSYVF
ncbi:MAG: hypothetical protein JW738_05025, partial [Actinobacteria bacterium]|nr:hypothetical protein [Actinomycetota bacterium]